MSDIEKEFFEAFGIEPKCQSQDKSGCKYCSNYDYTCKLNRTREKCDYLNKFGWAFNYYPPITSDIVLGLERIILDNQGNIIYLMELLDDYYCLCGDDYQYPTNEGRGTTRLNALLQLCIKLKHEISEEVKALFKC